MTKFTSFMALSVAIFGLTACETLDEADTQINSAARLTAEQSRRLAAAQRGEVIEVAQPYYGSAVAVELGQTRGRALPARFEAARGFVANFENDDLSKFAASVTNITGIPVNIRSTYTTVNWDDVQVLPAGRLNFSHSGALSKALDIATARTDTSWTYDGTAITIDTMQRETYQISAPAGNFAFSSQVNGISSASSSANLTRGFDALDVWADIENRIGAVAPPPSEVIINKNAGTVVVFGPPSVQAAAKRMVNEFDALYAQRVGLEIGVFFVDSSKLAQFEGGIEAAGTNYAISGLATALAGNGVATLSRGEGTISFAALARNDAVVDFRQASTVAQSGVWSPTVIRNSTNFVSGTQTSTTDGVTSTEVSTSTVDTGLSIHALPRITSNNQIQLSLTLLQSSLNGLDEFTSSGSTVQLPQVDERALQSDVVLTPGETLILSGYEAEYASRSSRRNNIFMGGNNDGEVRKVRMIVMVRPSIMPRDRGGRG